MDKYYERAAASYDRVAPAYAEQFFDELAHKPLDRALLTSLIELAGEAGSIADIGCGPGQVARYLHDRGAVVTGIDLSAGMVVAARAASPEVEFRQGSMLALPLEDGSLVAIVTFYAIIHLRPEEIGAAFREFCRVPRPGGRRQYSCRRGAEAGPPAAETAGATLWEVLPVRQETRLRQATWGD